MKSPYEMLMDSYRKRLVDLEDTLREIEIIIKKAEISNSKDLELWQKTHKELKSMKFVYEDGLNHWSKKEEIYLNGKNYKEDSFV